MRYITWIRANSPRVSLRCGMGTSRSGSNATAAVVLRTGMVLELSPEAALSIGVLSCTGAMKRYPRRASVST